MLRVAVFASGGGSNLQALLDRFGADGDPNGVARIALVVSDRPTAGALDRARRAGVLAKVIDPTGLDSDAQARSILESLRAERIDLVILAGYIRLIPEAVVREYRDRILNIHPSLLPAFGGKGMYGARVHRAVLEAGCRVSGATVHRVDERYDTGPILAQWPVPVLPDDTPETLAARVLRVEHRLLPAAVEAVARALREARSGGAADGSVEVRGEARGEVRGEVAGSVLTDPCAFSLESIEAPSEDEIRRALGLLARGSAEGRLNAPKPAIRR